MGKNSFTNLGETLLSLGGQDNFRSDNNQSNKIIYHAVVRVVDDIGGQNRIRAEFVSLDDKGNIKPGKDKDTPVDKLPICIPLLPETFHLRPKVGECVLIITENPSDLSSVRYWIGPLFTSQLKLPFQSYQDTVSSIYNSSTFAGNSNTPTSNQQKGARTSTVLPQDSEVALQGREDANITFRPREVVIRAGSFKKNSLEVNTEHPCEIQLKQFDDNPSQTGIKLVDKLIGSNFKPFSQQNIIATNINLISTEGKNRTFDSKNPEATTNPRLSDFGENAQKLHPLVFGDELIVLLRLILTYLITHIHTPQNPALPTPISDQLAPYISGDKLQGLVSNNVRTN